MAPLPKRRHSTRRQGKRRFSFKLSLKHRQKCPQCGKLRQTHRPCPACGYYSQKVPTVKAALASSKKTQP